MYACIDYHPPSCICTLCQLSSTALAMYQSLHMLVLYVYLQMLDASGSVYSSLVISKMKVTPIKCLTVPPWLELCGTCLLAELLCIVRDVLQLPSDQIFTWTDSIIVLSLLRGNPWWFKTYVANCVSQLFEILPPDCWRHVESSQNRWTVHPQVCTHLNFIIILYGGKELIGWSYMNPNGPASHMLLFILCHKKRKLCLYTLEQKVNHLSYLSHSIHKVLSPDHVTTWILWFIHNCQARGGWKRSRDVTL